jgi:hypothetical protein
VREPWPSCIRGLLVTSAVLLVCGVGPVPAAAQEAAPSAAELQRQLRQRDQAIAVLRRRLDALEKRLAETEKLAKGAVQMGEPGPPVVAPAPRQPAPPVAERPAAPGQFEVDPLAAERALERVLVRTGALLLEPGQLEVEPSLRWQRSESDGPIFFLGPGGVVTGVGAQRVRRDLFQAELGLRLGLPFDSQVELSLPYNYVDQDVVREQGLNPVGKRSASGNALGDISIGVAKTLLREEGWIPDLIGRLTWDTSSGERTDGGVFLPGGFDDLQVELVALKRSDPLVFVVGGTYQYSFENSDVKPGQRVGLSFGTILATSPSTSLRAIFETTWGGETEIGGDKLDGSDFVSASLNLGASIVLAPRLLFDVKGTIGLTDDAPDFGITVSLPIRFDTPLF